MYYLRTRPAVNAVQFTVNKLALKESTSNSTISLDEEMSIEEALTTKGKELRQVFDDKLNKQNKGNEEAEQQTECLMCSG
ncbi:hypothetical protein ACQ4LE_003913 [Meloidogyne hapla]